MNFFKDCTTLDEAKRKYRELVKSLHPDLGGSTAEFQAMQNEFESFEPESEKFKGEFEKWNAGDFMEIINQLIFIPSIKVEVVGSWIWVSGDTKPVKDQIKAIETGETMKRGFSRNKGMWYFSPVGYRKKSRKQFDFDDLKNMFGSEEVEKRNRKAIQ